MIRILLYCLLLPSLLACSDGSPDSSLAESPVVAQFMADPAAVARGQALFTGSCASFCHTLEPEADLDALFLFDCEWKHGGSDQEIFNVVTKGVPGTRMVGFGSNFPEGDDDLWKLIAYLRTNQQAC